ncbi:major facilitator superfamily domain-containing protein [Panaeolus papilionaceus]|nr:major facilitator superfamily domain-containing protein [Panaeolus papilionaceus]
MDHVGYNDNHDEQTPLLKKKRTQSPSKNRKERTPLPKLQIGIVLLLQVCEPICSQSIYPYINELVSTLDIIGGDTRKIGYYAGLIESLFFATEALTVFQWSRTSDRIGRKPVLMIGMIGTMLSMICFGLSRTFATLVISRCLCGLLNGNIGVMKSAMGELTDSTNRADAFALMPVVWALGATMGPLIGGSLARPADRFPSVFTGTFWKEFPYFLPCLGTVLFVFVTFIITGLFFKETTSRWQSTKRSPSRSSSSSSSDTLLESQQDEQSVGFRGLLIFPVMVSITNYVTLAFFNISVNALLPLFFHMPINMGGLNLEPATIGYIMGVYGAGTGLFQILFFAKLVRGFGTRRVFIWSMASFIPVFMLFPVISLVAKIWNLCWTVWVLIGLILTLLFFMDTAYGCIFMYVTESAPNRRSLGATNGLAQTTVSFARALGPALSTSLYSFSIQRNLLGGYGVYAIMATLGCLALGLASQLPNEPWQTETEAANEE